MAATALGILNHLSTTGHEQRNAAPLKNVTNNASGNNGTAASGADAAGITANDFLTLLVTEMKNQDPTANTDPNEYINQLVQVNSLEQLISINQTLTADSQGSPANDAARSTVGTVHGAAGNFTIPTPNPAAQRVAHSLGGVHPAV